jgi:hypothetical protein
MKPAVIHLRAASARIKYPEPTAPERHCRSLSSLTSIYFPSTPFSSQLPINVYPSRCNRNPCL